MNILNSSIQDLVTLLLQHFHSETAEISHSAKCPLCLWCSWNILSTDGSDNIFRHLTLIRCEGAHIFRHALIYLKGAAKMGISVGYKEALSTSLKSAHTAICAALYTEIDPQIIIA